MGLADGSTIGSRRLFTNPRFSVDDSLAYVGLVNSVIQRCSTVVDVGCGRGMSADDQNDPVNLFDFRGAQRTLIGIDVDPTAAGNPFVDEFRLIEGKHWPIETGSADLILSDWTLEHVESPREFISEVRRCLRSGGVFVARSVNRRSLLSLSARVVPNVLHRAALARMQPHRQEIDIFPTFYRMNTRLALSELLHSEFEFEISWRPAIENYIPASLGRSAKSIARLERLLPQRAQSVFVLAARLRS